MNDVWMPLPYEAVEFARSQLYYPLDVLKVIEQEAALQKVPIVPPEVAAFLYTMVRLKQPRRVLEVGSGAAFSTLWMAGALPPGGKILGLDRDHNRSVLAAGNIARAGFADRVVVLKLDALSPEGRAVVHEHGPYDMVFVDCEKRIYPELWSLCHPLLRGGGLFVADNVLFRGLVAKEYAERHNAQGVANLRLFIDTAVLAREYRTQIYPIGDGVLVAIKEAEEW